jgi:hypothetical protein
VLTVDLVFVHVEVTVVVGTGTSTSTVPVSPGVAETVLEVTNEPVQVLVSVVVGTGM